MFLNSYYVHKIQFLVRPFPRPCASGSYMHRAALLFLLELVHIFYSFSECFMHMLTVGAHLEFTYIIGRLVLVPSFLEVMDKINLKRKLREVWQIGRAHV